MHDLPRSVCCCSPASLLWHLGFYVEIEGLPVGCAPNGPAKYLWVLGRFLIWDLPEVGMPRVALPDSLQLCRISGCLYTPFSSKIYVLIASSIIVRNAITSSHDLHRWPSRPRFQWRYNQQPLHALSKIMLDILRYWTSSTWDLFEDDMPTRPPEVGPARLLVAMLGGLGVSTLRSIKTMTQFSSFFWASNRPCCLLQCSGTTLRVRLRRPLVFFVVPTCRETCFSSHRYSTYSFFSSSPLDHHTGHPARHDARILLYECILDALWNFFIVVSIY
jgi:hypothetical protein